MGGEFLQKNHTDILALQPRIRRSLAFNGRQLLRTKAAEGKAKTPGLSEASLLATHICFVAVSPGSRSAAAAGFSPGAGTWGEVGRDQHGGGDGSVVCLLGQCGIETARRRRPGGKRFPLAKESQGKAGGEGDGMLVKSWKCAGKM